MPNTLSSLSTPVMPPALSLLIMLLGAYVALDLGQRLNRPGTVERTPWLVAAALALSAGLWAAPILAIADLLAGHEFGFDAYIAGAAALLSAALSFAGLNWMQSSASSRLRRVAGACTLAAAALSAQMLSLLSLGLAPTIAWNFGWLVLAAACAAAGFAWGLGPLLARHGPHKAAQRQLLAAAIVSVAAMAAQVLTIEAAGLPGLSLQWLDSHIPAATMASLASLGGAELLLLMLLACVVETRMRGTLEKAREQLQAHALRDELTGLPNRVSFEGTLAQLQQQADTHHGQVVLMLVALDGFKHVNESFGHQFGDRVLRRMAQRLRGMVKPHGVARLGGDEYLLLLSDDQAAKQSALLAQQVLESIAQTCSVDGREISITCSIGMAIYPQHGSMSTLVTNASVAMRASKSAGGATYSLFDPRMVVDSREQAELLRDLRMALSRSQLELYYQPKIHAPSAQITGVEALLRWHHPQRGMISPNIFIPMAERSGVINALGLWVIDEACRQARVWRDQGMRMRVAINLSAYQLRQSDLPQHISAALTRHQINPGLLTCEITESVAMEDTEATKRFFDDLALIGVHISIDDFGSGYSSLAYLRKLPAGELKIDRSFVLDLAHSEEARKIAAAVVQLAQALNLKVVAEGVETEEQFQILRQLGCDELQGFLFAKPMSAKALTLWALADEGPRSMQFSESLFRETRALAL